MKRQGGHVEVSSLGTISFECLHLFMLADWAQHGVHYRISPEPTGSLENIFLSPPPIWAPFRVAQIAGSVHKAIWFQPHFDFYQGELKWDNTEDLTLWLKERAERLAERSRIGMAEYEERKVKNTIVSKEQAYY